MTGYCWRCSWEDVEIVRDPMADPRDSGLGVCGPCASERIAVMCRYIAGGTNLEIIEPSDDCAPPWRRPDVAT